MAKLELIMDATGAKKGADDFKAAVGQVNNSAESLKSAVAGAGRSLAGWAAGVVSVYKLSEAFKFCVTSAMAMESAEGKLGRALNLSSTIRKDAVAELRAYAEGISQVTTYCETDILAQMAYGKNLGLTAGQLKDATKAAIGLAEKYSIDLPEAMKLIGRASQGSTIMLERYDKTIAGMVSPQEKFNEAMRKGKIAFDQLALNPTSTSSLFKQVGNAMEDAARTIGENFLPQMKVMEKDLIKNAKDFADWAKDNKEAIMGVAEAMKDLLHWTGVAFAEVFKKIDQATTAVADTISQPIAKSKLKEQAISQYKGKGGTTIGSLYAGANGLEYDENRPINQQLYRESLMEVISNASSEKLRKEYADWFSIPADEIEKRIKGNVELAKQVYEKVNIDASGELYKKVGNLAVYDSGRQVAHLQKWFDENAKKTMDFKYSMQGTQDKQSIVDGMQPGKSILDPVKLESYKEAMQKLYDETSSLTGAEKIETAINASQRDLYKKADFAGVFENQKAKIDLAIKGLRDYQKAQQDMVSNDALAGMQAEIDMIGKTTLERERAIKVLELQKQVEKGEINSSGKDAQLKKFDELGRAKQTYEGSEMLRGLDEERQLLGKTGDERERMVMQLDLEAKARSGAINMQDGQIQAYQREFEELQKLKRLETIAVGIGDAFGNAFEDMVLGAKSAGEAMRALAMDVERLVMRKMITEPLAAGISSFAMSMFAPSMPAAGNGMTDYSAGGNYAALGKVFNSEGAMTPFAYGGIVNRPTKFGMKGGTGLMGEFGSEAIMPLKRMGDGTLGVKSDGSGGNSAPTIIVNNNSGTSMKQDGEGKFDGKNWVITIVADNIDSGGLLREKMRGING